MSASTVTPRRAKIAFALGTLFFGYAFIQRVSPSVMTSELMRDFSVGGAALGSLSAFYFYAYASIQLPVGMLTDRDICMAALNSGCSLDELEVSSAMSSEVFYCNPDTSIEAAERTMGLHQVRRLPVIDEEGHAQGLLSLDDIAREALRLAAMKLPIKTRVVVREDW